MVNLNKSNPKIKFCIIIKIYKFLKTRFNIRLNLLMNSNLINIMIILKTLMVMNIFSIIPQKNDTV